MTINDINPVSVQNAIRIGHVTRYDLATYFEVLIGPGKTLTREIDDLLDAGVLVEDQFGRLSLTAELPLFNIDKED